MATEEAAAEEAEAEEAEPEAEEVVIEAEPDDEEDERHAFEIICEQLGVHVWSTRR